uniref:Uncharacterized protein n=1 Tax=Moniliophthora roreri TaxID=221103 RepID=A0A0W0GAW9_MONRR
MTIANVFNAILSKLYTLLMSIYILFKRVHFPTPRKAGDQDGGELGLKHDTLDLERGEGYSTTEIAQSVVHLNDEQAQSSASAAPSSPTASCSYMLDSPRDHGPILYPPSLQSNQQMLLNDYLSASQSKLDSICINIPSPSEAEDQALITLKSSPPALPVRTTYQDSLSSNSAGTLYFHHGRILSYTPSSSGSSLASRFSSRNRFHYIHHVNRNSQSSYPSTSTHTFRRPTSSRSINSFGSTLSGASSQCSSASVFSTIANTSFPRPPGPGRAIAYARTPTAAVDQSIHSNAVAVTPPQRSAYVPTHRKQSPIVWYKDMSLLVASASISSSSSSSSRASGHTRIEGGRGANFSLPSHIGQFRYPYQYHQRSCSHTPVGKISPLNMKTRPNPMQSLSFHFPPPTLLSPLTQDHINSPVNPMEYSDLSQDVIALVRRVIADASDEDIGDGDSARALVSRETIRSLARMEVLDEAEEEGAVSSVSISPPYADQAENFVEEKESGARGDCSELVPYSPSNKSPISPHILTPVTSLADPDNSDISISREADGTAYLPYPRNEDYPGPIGIAKYGTTTPISGMASGDKLGSSVSLKATPLPWSPPTRRGDRFSYPSTYNFRPYQYYADRRVSVAVSWSDLVTFSSYTLDVLADDHEERSDSVKVGRAEVPGLGCGGALVERCGLDGYLGNGHQVDTDADVGPGSVYGLASKRLSGMFHEPRKEGTNDGATRILSVFDIVVWKKYLYCMYIEKTGKRKHMLSAFGEWIGAFLLWFSSCTSDVLVDINLAALVRRIARVHLGVSFKLDKLFEVCVNVSVVLSSGEMADFLSSTGKNLEIEDFWLDGWTRASIDLAVYLLSTVARAHAPVAFPV